jgi:hypothetical protein
VPKNDAKGANSRQRGQFAHDAAHADCRDPKR